MADLTTGASQALAGDLFTDMVLEQAINDKKVEIEKQAKDAEGNVVAPEDYDKYDAEGNLFEEKGESDDDADLDDDFAMGDEEEKIMRQMAEERLADMRADYHQKQENKAMGHGTYREIVE